MRLRIEVAGAVQGVGFRPHVYQCATDLKLTGWVQNTGAGVVIEVQGEALEPFLKLLVEQAPPLAVIDQLSQSRITPLINDLPFFIKSSAHEVCAATKITPDVTVCDACLQELFDPASRFYRYPFINCTHCGPRYSITKHLPYDRVNTSMAEFSMCSACLDDYQNPHNRRYHAQPIACSYCGPQLSTNIADIVQAITDGKIVAAKGLGGYQLIVNAYDEKAVARLRARKKRAAKPFAIMVLNEKSAENFVELRDEEEALLTSHQRPIVLLRQKTHELPNNIAPDLNTLGVMLPDTPFHYVLFHALLACPEGYAWLSQKNKRVLIVTSANLSGHSIICNEQEAQSPLDSVADVVVHHNRPIISRVDDSVMRSINHQRVMIRRARGFVPEPVPLPREIPSTLALGSYLKNTVCVTRGCEAFISQYIGDLNSLDTVRMYHETIAKLLKLLNVKPECVAHDAHPNFYSTQYAASFNLPSYAVQHHHAHLASTAVEYGITAPALGLALDGFGLGDDGDAWGGELMHYQTSQCDRLGSLSPLAQPGGEKAAQQPWRMAASILFALNKKHDIFRFFSHYPQCAAIIELLEKNVHSPSTSSLGRLFDAASALLGICEINDYEGQAAQQLESIVTQAEIYDKGWEFIDQQLNLLPLFTKLLQVDAVCGANLFHGTVARALTLWVKRFAKDLGLKTVLLGGGCYQNKTLTECLITGFEAEGLNPLLPQRCPPNDGGISLGQAWAAGNQMSENK